jgi:hypothetical protein
MSRLSVTSDILEAIDWLGLQQEEDESVSLENYPTPRCRISTLNTASVRLLASGQHYEAYYFDKSKPKGYNRTLNAYCGHDDYLFGCNADYGSKSGDPVCCGQKGMVRTGAEGTVNQLFGRTGADPMQGVPPHERCFGVTSKSSHESLSMQMNGRHDASRKYDAEEYDISIAAHQQEVVGKY